MFLSYEVLSAQTSTGRCWVPIALFFEKNSLYWHLCRSSPSLFGHIYFVQKNNRTKSISGVKSLQTTMVHKRKPRMKRGNCSRGRVHWCKEALSSRHRKSPTEIVENIWLRELEQRSACTLSKWLVITNWIGANIIHNSGQTFANASVFSVRHRWWDALLWIVCIIPWKRYDFI